MTDAPRAIHSLLATYAARLDAGDFAGMAALFATATVSSVGGGMDVRGADEVLAIFERSTRRFADGTPRTKHVTTNAIVEVDEATGTATSRSYFTVFQQTDSLDLQPVIAGRYHDRFRVHAGTWSFTDRRIIIDLVGELREHLFPGAAAADS